MKRKKKFPRRPSSFGKVHDKTLERYRPRKQRSRRTDLCREIYWKKSCAERTTALCGNDFYSIISRNEELLIKQAIGDSDICENMCDRNPCQNRGECRAEKDGFECKCTDEFEGRYCEVPKPQVTQCDYYRAFACLDIFHTSKSYFQDNLLTVYCSSISRQKACLSAYLRVCSETDQAIVELIFFYLESLQTNCKVQQEPTCEQMELYVIFQEIINIVYSTAGPPNSDGDQLCLSFRFAYERVLSINMRCAATTLLSYTAADKFSGAVDIYCRSPTCGCDTPKCSLTVADDCLEQIYEILVRDPFTKEQCTELWERKKCVLDATESCGPDKMALVMTALSDLEKINPDNTCPNPCSKNPCRNGGVCRQTSVDDYKCMCPEEYTGKSCQTPKGCDFVEVRLCLEEANELIADGIFDRCNPAVDCSTIKRLLDCIDVNTKKCDKKRLDGVTQIKVSLNVLKEQSCGVTPPPGCKKPPTECDISTIQECYARFTSITFRELASGCVVNYGHICQHWSVTIGCIQQASAACTGPDKVNVDFGTEWLVQLTGSRCLKAICLPEVAIPGQTCVDDEIDANKGRSTLPDSDRSDFCVYIDTILSAIEDNVEQCADSVRKPIRDKTSKTRESQRERCSYPCTDSKENPCKNNGTCVQKSYDKYECRCVGDYAGDQCTQTPLYPHDDDTELRCREDGLIDSSEIKLKIPIQAYCQAMNSFYVSQDGYISFSATTMSNSYDSLCLNGNNLLAPLFAKQDCSCSGSSVSVRVYYSSENSASQQKVFRRSKRDLSRFKSVKSFTLQVVAVITWSNMLPSPCSVYKQTVPDIEGSDYQAIVYSDTKVSYVQFVYKSVHTAYQGKFVHSGITSAQGLCQGSYLSGTRAMDHFEVTTNTDTPGSYIYSMDATCSPIKPKPEDQCLAWVVNTVDLSKEQLDFCPCASFQASLDARYHLNYIDWFRHCYTVNRVQRISKNGKITRVRQSCCYDQFNKGALFSTAPYAANPVVIDNENGQLSDSEAYNMCCVQSNKYCGLYRGKRPSATCNTYTSTMEGLMWGDPHMITTDGHNYTFNGIGEYKMVEATDKSFRLQARTAQMTNGDGAPVGASAYVSFAAQETGSSKVQVELNANGDGIVWYIDGDLQKTPAEPDIYPTDIYISATDTIINITFPSGWTTTIGVRMKMLAIRQTIPASAWNMTRGLLGNYNGDKSDDLTGPDGKSIPLTSSMEEIHKFGVKWQISANESILRYPAGKTTADYTNAAFKPEMSPPCKTDVEIAMGKKLCGNDTDCYYDYCVTKNPAVAAGTKSTADGFNSGRRMLMNLGPKLTIKGMTADSNGIYSIQASVGKEVSFILYAESDQSIAMTIATLGNVSKEAKVSLASMSSTRNSTSAMFKWTPTSLNPVDVSFIAMDANAAMSARLQAIVTICNGCGGHGSCKFTSSTPINNGSAYRLADCSCSIGWSGSNCMKDYNGCQSSMSCLNGAACTDLTAAQQQATGLLYSCSACPPGYHTEQCIDIDECSIMPANSKCQICMNVIGSYTCKCRPGYRLAANKVECEDIDECAEQTSKCPESCTNTVGSFVCGCLPGYQGPNCDPITVCGKNDCSYKCAMINGQQKCSCMSGFSLASDGISCSDINECSNPDLNRCSVKTLCSNTLGGYTCGCNNGNHVTEDLRTCEPCSDTTWGPNCANDCNCGPNVESCSKTSGCTICRNGWQGPECAVDIDECAVGTARCAQGATCENTAGTYWCKCADGSGYSCYETTTVPRTTQAMIPCDYNHCQNDGLCFLDSNNFPTCSCTEEFAGEACEIRATQMSASSKVGLIAGLSVLGAVLLLAAAALIFYFVVYPKIKAAKKLEDAPSEIHSDKSLTKFDQTSTRLTKFWPGNPSRYSPETYSSDDVPSVSV
jgi:hypothetical protein